MEAKPGTKAYGILSVLIQAWYDVEYLFTVDEYVFDPPPKVKSAVIRMTRNKVQDLGCDEKLFRRVVKTVHPSSVSGLWSRVMDTVRSLATKLKSRLVLLGATFSPGAEMPAESAVPSLETRVVEAVASLTIFSNAKV